VTGRQRWMLVAAVLVVGAAVALWPYLPSSGNAEPTSSPPQADLSVLRGKADLAACPRPGVGGGPAGLRGIEVDCLGDGSRIDLAAVLAGRRAVINFWEPWCAPCRAELGVLQAYAAEPGAALVLLVQAPDESDAASGLDMLAGSGIRLPAVYDYSGAAAKALGKPGAFPISYVLDAGGAVSRVTEPAVFETTEQVRQAVSRQNETR